MRFLSGPRHALALLPLAIAGAWLASPAGAAANPGQIAYDGCLGNDGLHGCLDLPGEPLDAANGVAVSPDGGSLYVASQISDSIVHFFREPVPAPTPGPPPPAEPPAADTLAPSITGLALTNRRFRARTTFRYTLSEAASVTITIERALRRRRYVTVATLTRAGNAGPNRLRFSGRIGRSKLRPGAYRARFTATDPAGNRSSSAAVRLRIVRTTTPTRTEEVSK